MAAITYTSGEELIKELQKRFSSDELGLVKQAYAFAQSHYDSIMHPTGRSYLEYVLGVARVLADINSAPIVLAASLINPPLPVQPVLLKELKYGFASYKELLRLIEGIFLLSNLEWDVWYASPINDEDRARKETLLKTLLLAIDDTESDEQAREMSAAPHFQKREKQIENIVRMFLAQVTDIRALVIKLADRLHCMKLMKNLDDSQKASFYVPRLARISLAIYAPIADRLGLWQLKSELEDMSFRLLDMQKYKEIAGQLKAKKQDREKVVSDVLPEIENALAEYGVKAEVSGRAKHLYSIYKKMELKQLELEQINDLLGIRIIMETIQDCYDAQDIIHDMWPPITSFYDGEAGRDWIANPKENGYQSLHTTIKVHDKIVEVQIRTHEMHETAEFGAAAEHWRYKDPKIYRKGKVPRVTKEKDIKWGKQLVELRKNLHNQEEASTLMRKGLLKEYVYVITPEGHVIDLPKGATPLDFAYHIHTELGHHYTGARVNGQIARLNYKLQNGEVVQLITSRQRPEPNRDWLTAIKDEEGNSIYVFARTHKARKRIHEWLNKHKANLLL